MYYHATLMKLPEGTVLDQRRAPARMNPRPHAETTSETYQSGRTFDDSELIWMTTDADEAEGWAERASLKCCAKDIRTLRTDGVYVYEVEPIGDVEVRLTPHSPTECGAPQAKILGVAHFEPMAWQDFLFERDDDGGWIVPPGTCPECGDELVDGVCPSSHPWEETHA